MQETRKIYLYRIVLLLLLFLVLTHPTLCAKLAGEGLMSWFHIIIPNLFPFMIITSILQELHIDFWLSHLLDPVLYFLPGYSSIGKYCLIIGLLCGFPMGAKIIIEQYQEGTISKQEAELLLPACNQFSPAFMVGILYPTIQTFLPNISIFSFLVFMYGAPIGYIVVKQKKCLKESTQAVQTMKMIPINTSIPEALDHSLTKNILPIIKIGSYMIIFRVLNCIPAIVMNVILPYFSIQKLKTLIRLLYLNSVMSLEITTGLTNISTLSDTCPILLLYLICVRTHLGGISCLMQTYTFIQGSDLSMFRYYRTKMLFSFLTCIIVSIYIM